MDGKFDLLTVLAFVVALVAIFKLRSVLGRRTSDDEARIDRRLRAEQEADAKRDRAAAGKVVTLPRRDRDDAQPAPQSATVAVADVEARFLKVASGDKALQQQLLAVYRADNSFDPEQFMQGAKGAYEMIVTAFAEGNRKVLKDLLSREVFDGFSTAIGDREGRGEQIDQSFVGINKADIVETEVKGGTAQVTVKFVSQLISATRDRGGQIVTGDPQKITEVTDIWTFARELGSRNPNWRLIATQASN
jgi:predicted lipid-binding transport protein (Tim44 family)